MPPMPKHPIPEYAETVEVPRYRIVVEVALHDRLEPVTGLTHGIVHTLPEPRIADRGWKSRKVSPLPVEGEIFFLTFPFIEQAFTRACAVCSPDPGQ